MTFERDELREAVGDEKSNLVNKEIQKKIESLGGKVAGSVSKKTAYLINNDVESSSSKNKDAKKNGVPIITEEEFLKLLS